MDPLGHKGVGRLVSVPEADSAVLVAGDELLAAGVPVGSQQVTGSLLLEGSEIGQWLPTQSVPELQVAVLVANQQLGEGREGGEGGEGGDGGTDKILNLHCAWHD